MEQDVNWLVQQVATTLLGNSNNAGQSQPKLLGSKALSSLSPNRTWLAFSWRQQLAIADLSAAPNSPEGVYRGALSGTLGWEECLTALCWVSFSSTQSQSLERPYLLLGTSLGYLQLHNATGRLLHRQRMHSTACCSIKVRNQGQGLDAEDRAEDVTVCFSNAVVRINAVDVLSLAVRASRATTDGAATDLAVAHTKWELPRSAGPRSCALCLGTKPATLYERMLGRSTSPKLLLLTTGKSPAVASYEAPEWGSEGVLAMVSELASGVAGLARTLATGRPNGVRAGLRSWVVGATPRAAVDKQPGPDKVPVPPGHASTISTSLADDPRVATTLTVAPRGALAAAGDSLGRVLLIDTATLNVVRLWKAYRHAQLAWLSLPNRQQPGDKAGEPELLLVLYSPKRAHVEIWQPRLGARLYSWHCGRSGLLFDPPASFGGKTGPEGPCFLFCEKGTVVDLVRLAQQAFRRESRV